MAAAIKSLSAFFYTLLLAGFCLQSTAQTSSFTYQSSNSVFCNPSTISFTQTCTGNPIGFTWSFDNGQFSNAPNPTITFAAGTYVVKLVAVFESQAVESSQTIVVNPSITGTIAADRNYICTPGIVNFTATSSGNIASYEWNFGDASATVTTTNGATSHNYAALGTYTATVKAIDASGCFITTPTTIEVKNPPLSGNATPSNGCVPAFVNFTANVTLPTGGSVTSYLYDYGDGTAASATPSHTYPNVGSYTPSVTITTNEGCTNTLSYGTIAFGTPPTNHIAVASKPVYCGSETAAFTSTADNANSWLWDYGDAFTETLNTGVTQHKYATLGPKTITVTPYFNGCPGPTLQINITIVGVIAKYDYTNTCTAPKTFTFTNTSLGNQSVVLWNFGDGSPTSAAPNTVTHTFPASGSFVTSLTITDNATGCVDVFSTTIFTASPTLVNNDLSICRNSSTTFTLQNNYTNASANYGWNVVGYPNVINNAASYTLNAGILGNFNNNFVVINNGSQYCADTVPLNHPIIVKGPNLSFTAATDVCANSNYLITNTSTPFIPADSVKLWYWKYGTVPTNDTVYQPQPIKYGGAGVYTIKLFAKDINGCTDSLQKQVTVKAIPFLRVFPRGDTLCLGEAATLIAFHSDTLSWSPAQTLSCATCDTVIANPTVTTLYYARANNSLNCPVIDSTLVTVFAPFTSAALMSPVYVCLNDSAIIDVLPAGKKITWSPTTNISNSNVYAPKVSPPVNTTYFAALEDSAGCFKDTASVDVIVKTLPTVNAGPDKILPYNSFFSIAPQYSANIISYEWAPADSLTCSTCPVISGTALISQQYSIKVTNDSGCVAKDVINIFIECKYANLLMPSAFTPNRDGLNDVYYPLSRGIKTVKSFIIFNRYGQKVFEAKNFTPNSKNFGWDGKVKGIDQNAESYVYVLESICDLGETISRKGSFLLLR